MPKRLPISKQTRLGVFADANDKAFLDWVFAAANLAEIADHEIAVIPVDRQGIRGREYGGLIRNLDACIIDVSHKGLITLSARLGSIADNIDYWLGDYSCDSGLPWHWPLDSKILLVTRSAQEQREIEKFAGGFYTRISLVGGINREKTRKLADWIKETIASAIPKIFVSYRATQRKFAKTVANTLQTKGAAVWFDEWKILPGDSIPAGINRGLGWCSHLIMIVDKTFFQSKWAKAEVESVLYRHLSPQHFERRWRFHERWNERPLIPIFLVDPNHASMPPLLARIRGVDCRRPSDFSKAMEQLWTAITTVGRR